MHVNKTFIRFLNRLRLLKFFNLLTTLSYDGRMFKIPIRKGVGYAHCATFEDWLLRIMSRMENYLDGEKSFVDVGVNIGQSLLIMKSIFPDIRYVGFEPNPVCIEYTRELIRLNHIGHATVYPFGLSNKSHAAELNFYYNDADDSSASIIAGFRKGEIKQRREIALRRGDELEDWTSIRPGVIKIDVEGAELEVISGLERVIENYRPCIICEVLPAYSHENQFRIQRQAMLQERLMKHNYNLYHISTSGDINRIYGFDVHASVNACNYLFVPGEHTIEIN